MNKMKDNSLYLVITEEYGMGRSAVDIARAAIAGGVDIIQMREKDLSYSKLLEKGRALLSVCKEGGVPLIINDDPSLAKELGADGVHLGQEDVKKYSVESVRNMLGRESIIGVSTHSFAEFREADGWDVDYIAFGPVFRTKTKDYFIGTGEVGKVLAAAVKPVFFIGGIDLSSIDELTAMGAGNIALIRGITEADDITARARQFKEKLTIQKVR
jgi:thiamine-phosphate diphosphorylase